VSDLESELGSLQETARRADELAATVERRISELKGDTVERTERLEADLAAARRRVEELEAHASGVDTLAEELRATTAKLEEVNRVLEGSVR
jgi:chromosome segregation ATPase